MPSKKTPNNPQPPSRTVALSPGCQVSSTPHIVGQVESRSVDQLVPYARNARTHSASQIKQLAASIKEFGFVSPVLIAPDNQIIAGHARVLAAKKLRMSEVPVIVLAHLSESQRRALMLADNQLALNARWDEKLLRAELEALQKEKFPLDLLGFGASKLKAQLADLEAAQRNTDPDAVPSLPVKAVSQPGDLWILGKHRVLCGDAARWVGFDILMNHETAAMVFTDPPSEEEVGKSSDEFFRHSFSELLKVCRGGVYICGCVEDVGTAFVSAGGLYETLLIWAKTRPTPFQTDYAHQYEPLLYGWRKGAKRSWYGGRDQGDLWWIAEPQGNREYPNIKPVELVERAIKNSSQAGDIVLDPFAGTGSTLIACERLKRRAYLMEIDARYVDVICRRWQQFTGQPAVLLDSDGKTFDEIACGREKEAA